MHKGRKTIVKSSRQPESRQSFVSRYVQYFILAGIILGAIGLRWISADFQGLLGADSWWFYRHAEEIYNNNFAPLKWDNLSYSPPGRPAVYYIGWSYTIAIFYAITQPFLNGMTMMQFSGLFTPVFASLAAIPAYFVGRMITNRWGGLLAALFAVMSPKFVGVSLAGYPDSDAPVVFYTFLAVLTTLYAIKKSDKLNFETFKGFAFSLPRYLPYIAPALLAYWLFGVNWNFSWYIFFVFLFFIPVLALFRLIEGKLLRREKGFAFVMQKIRENRSVVVPVLLIGVIGELISVSTYTWPYFTIPLHQQMISGLNFLQAGPVELSLFALLLVSLGGVAGFSLGKVKGLLAGGVICSVIVFAMLSSGVSGQQSTIVNQSIVELQPIQFSSLGYQTILWKVGSAPIIIGGIGILGVMFFKSIRRKEITAFEYFVFFWVIVSMFLITAGERFSLMLTMAVAVASGLVVGNIVEHLRSKKGTGLAPQVYALIIFGVLLLGADNVNYAYPVSERSEVSGDWLEAMTWLRNNADKNSLILNWWHHGHMLAAFTGLKVHSDGAHCTTCAPYGHDARMIDLGRILTTSSEDESLDLIRKYAQIDPDKCQTATKKHSNILPSDACSSVNETYVIASKDLIGHYYWMSYYGSYDRELQSGKGTGYDTLNLTDEDANGMLLYDNGRIAIDRSTEQPVPLAGVPQQGNASKTFNQFVYFDRQGIEKRVDSDSSSAVEGLLWSSPDWQYVLYMTEEVRDSVFTKLLFFDGEGLEHFQPVFQSSEVKVYRVRI
jgi:hypothetical protein